MSDFSINVQGNVGIRTPQQVDIQGNTSVAGNVSTTGFFLGDGGLLSNLTLSNSSSDAQTYMDVTDTIVVAEAPVSGATLASRGNFFVLSERFYEASSGALTLLKDATGDGFGRLAAVYGNVAASTSPYGVNPTERLGIYEYDGNSWTLSANLETDWFAAEWLTVSNAENVVGAFHYGTGNLALWSNADGLGWSYAGNVTLPVDLVYMVELTTDRIFASFDDGVTTWVAVYDSSGTVLEANVPGNMLALDPAVPTVVTGTVASVAAYQPPWAAPVFETYVTAGNPIGGIAAFGNGLLAVSPLESNACYVFDTTTWAPYAQAGFPGYQGGRTLAFAGSWVVAQQRYPDYGNVFVADTAQELRTVTTATYTSVSATAARVEVAGNLGVSGSATANGYGVSQQTVAGACGVVVHDLALGSVFEHVNPASDFTPNFVGVPPGNVATKVELIINQAENAYLATGVQVSGVAMTPRFSAGDSYFGNTAAPNTVQVQTITILPWANSALVDIVTYF